MVVHHPIFLPKFIVLVFLIVLLVWLHGVLRPEQWLIALAASVLFVGVFMMFMTWLIGRLARKPRSVVGKSLVLQGRSDASEGYVAADVAKRSLIGKRGKTLSMLRPAGKVKIEGLKIDAVSDGEFIPRGCDVEVVEVEGNRVIVKMVE